ncbi:hypothetical protein D3C87_1234180 [compost metagenome]
MPNEIPEGLRDFMKKYINSVSLLEVLLMLKRDPTRSWTAQDISNEMRTNPSYASAQLGELIALKLVVPSTREDAYSFDAQSPHSAVIDELEELYSNRRPTIINFIYAPPIDSIRDFANAFKIKKD